MNSSSSSPDAAYQLATRGQISQAAIVRLIALVSALGLIAASAILLPAERPPTTSPAFWIGGLFFDRWPSVLFYPLTLQNVMWLAFAFGSAELIIRHLTASQELQQLQLQLLPEDAESMLRQGADVVPYLKKVEATDPKGLFWMQRLLRRLMLNFQGTGSIERTQAMLNASLELYQNEIDLRYNALRYVVWLIPTLGFIGTVVGILLALFGAGEQFGQISGPTDVSAIAPKMMERMTSDLGLAFYTTLLALLQSAVLMLAMHFVQGREESALNSVGQYCLDNLINRLYQRNP